MEILIRIISFSLIIALVVSPIIILIGLKRLKIKKYIFLTYLTLGIFITAIIALTFGWWLDYSNEMLLSHYGYDFDAMNDKERFSNVMPRNWDKVKSLEVSMMGIGWPLKTIMTFSVYSPYLLFIYVVAFLIQWNRKRITPVTKTTSV
jgi:hypothetical protein